jgi:hypothetical protein
MVDPNVRAAWQTGQARSVIRPPAPHIDGRQGRDRIVPPYPIGDPAPEAAPVIRGGEEWA